MLIFIVHFTYASNLIKNFSTLELPSNSSHLFSLLDYFSGNSLSFGVTKEDGKGSFKITNTPDTLVLNQYRDRLLKFPASIQNYQMPVLNIGDQALSCYFVDNRVIVLQTDLNKGHSHLNSIVVVSSLSSNFKIKSVVPVPSDFSGMYVFVAGEGNLGKTPSHEFYLIVLPIATQPLYVVNKIIIAELKEGKDFILGNGSANNLVALIGSLDEKRTIFIISITFSKAKLVQSLQNITLGFLNQTLDPISVTIADSSFGVLLLVLDSKSFLFIYNFTQGYFALTWMFNMNKYGEVFKIYYNGLQGPNEFTVFVSTSSGIVAANLKKQNENLFFSTDDLQSYITLGLFASDDLLLMIFQNNKSLSLSMGIVSFDYPMSALRIFKFNYLKFMYGAPWAFIRGTAQVYVLRVEMETLSVLQSDPIKPKLEISTLNTSISFRVIASDSISNQTSTLNVSILEDVYNPSLVYQGLKYTQPLKESFLLTQNQSFYPLSTSMVSGFNINCYVSDYQPKDKNYEIFDATQKKVSQVSMIPKNIIAKYSVLGKYLLAINEDFVNISVLGNSSSVRVNISRVLRVLQTPLDKNFNLFLFFLRNPHRLCVYMIFPNDLSGKPLSNTLLFPFKPLKPVVFRNYLAVASFDSILVYKLIFNSKYLIYDLILNKNRTDPILQMSITQDPSVSSPFVLYVGHKLFVSIYFESDVTEKPAETFYVFDPVINYFQLTAEKSKIFISTDNKLIVFRTFFREVLQELSLNIRDFFLLDDFIVYSSNSSFVVLNSTESFLAQSVYYEENLNSREIIGFTYNIKNEALILLQNYSHLIILNSSCPSNSCANEVRFGVLITNKTCMMYKAIPLNINVSCSGISKSLNLIYSITIKPEKNLITSKKDLSNITSSHLNKDIYYLTDYYSGYNLKADVFMDSKLLEKNETPPAYIQQSIDIISTFGPSDQLKTMTDFTIIRHLSAILIATAHGKMFYITNFFHNTTINEFVLPIGFPNTCTLIRNYGNQENVNLIILACSKLEGNKTVFKIYAAAIQLDTQILLNMKSLPLTYLFEDLKIIPGSLSEFAIAVIEKGEDMPNGNNNVEIFHVQWEANNINLTYIGALNFFTLGLTKFLCKSVEGSFGLDRNIEILLADYYYGLRILTINLEFDYLTVKGIVLGKQPLILGLCDRLLFVACKGSSVITYKRTNGIFSFFRVFPEYLTQDLDENNGRGIITCNSYYDARYFVISYQTHNSTLIRMYDLTTEYSNAIIKDIKFTESGFNTGGLFFNESVVLVYETLEGRIFAVSIQDLSLIFPKFSNEEFEKVEALWGKAPFSLKLNVSNDFEYLITDILMEDTEILTINSKGEATKIAWYYLFAIACLVLAVIGIISVFSYWIILRKRKKTISQIKDVKFGLASINRISAENMKIIN